MASITVVGLGPGPLALMTKEAEQHLLAAEKVFFRTSAYPAYDWLAGLGKQLVAFDGFYSLAWPTSDEMYEFMVTALLKEADNKASVTYALPGSPSVLEDTTRKLRRRARDAGIDVKIVEGLSFVELALTAVDFDFSQGLQVVLPRAHLERGLFDPRLAMLVSQVDTRAHPTDPPRIDLTVDWLLAAYPPDHPVTLIWTSGLPEYETRHINLRLDQVVAAYGTGGYYYASLFVTRA